MSRKNFTYAKDECDLKVLDFIRRNIINAKDVIDPVWYSTLMLLPIVEISCGNIISKTFSEYDCMRVQGMADSERFELSVPVRIRTLSRGVVSANSPNCPCGVGL